MTVVVHRQLDLFKALGLDTIFEVGLLSVEPTHTGRGEQTYYKRGGIFKPSINPSSLQNYTRISYKEIYTPSKTPFRVCHSCNGQRHGKTILFILRELPIGGSYYRGFTVS